MGRRPPLQTHKLKFPLVPGQSYMLIPKWTNVRSVLPNSHIHQSSHAGWRSSWWNFPVLFSLYVKDMPSPSRDVELDLYADDTAIIATSRQPALLVKYLETYLSDLERWLSKWRIAINVSKSSAMLFAKTGRRIQNPEQYSSSGSQSNGSTSLSWSYPC